MRRTTTSATPESYYFAYGANLHIAHMKSRCPRSAPVCAARLEDYRLTIALPATAPDNQPGWATVTPEPGAGTPGALFRLHADDLPALDRFEDYPALYMWKSIYIMVQCGKRRARRRHTTDSGKDTRISRWKRMESVLGEISSYIGTGPPYPFGEVAAGGPLSSGSVSVRCASARISVRCAMIRRHDAQTLSLLGRKAISSFR